MSLHPYTRTLMAAVPRMDKKWEAVAAEVEQAVPAHALPAGWTFFDSGATAGMNGKAPPITPTLVEVEPNHFVACVQP